MCTHIPRQYSSRLQFKMSLHGPKYLTSSVIEGILLSQKENWKTRCKMLQNFKYIQNQKLGGGEYSRGWKQEPPFKIKTGFSKPMACSACLQLTSNLPFIIKQVQGLIWPYYSQRQDPVPSVLSTVLHPWIPMFKLGFFRLGLILP